MVWRRSCGATLAAEGAHEGAREAGHVAAAEDGEEAGALQEEVRSTTDGGTDLTALGWLRSANEEGQPPAEEVVSEDSNPESDEESDEESETERKKKTYMSLLKSLESGSSQPASKKRKLDHSDSVETAQVEPAVGVSDSEEEEEEEEEKADVDEEEDDLPKDPDHVDETEDQSDSDDEDEEEDQADTADPFETHFVSPDEQKVTRRIHSIKKNEWTTAKVSDGGSRMVFSLPGSGSSSSSAAAFSPPAAVTGPGDLKLKQKLLESVLQSKRPVFDAVEQSLAPLLFNYYDMLYCERTPANGQSLRHIACLHAVNHVFKTRDKVIKNNAKVARDDGRDDVEYRDQGYTRPKVLMLLPTRQSCVRMVEAICGIWRPEQQENRKRFDDTYDDRLAVSGEDRPADFRDLFDGNDDDMFRLGLKFTRRSIKYFSQFYNSDIILASPLGLRMAMGSDDTLLTSKKASADGQSDSNSRSKTDYDFLSSIELVVVDQADALLMQNWEHVEHIFAHLNRQPRDAHGCDFNRVRSWYLDGQASHFRQTVVLSAMHTPALAELFRHHAANWTGKVRVQPVEHAGVIGRLGVRGLRQTFSRFSAPTVEAEPDARFDYFIKAVVPAVITKAGRSAGSVASTSSGGILVFIPSYLDFVRVRNWFSTSVATANISFGQVSEYASTAEASRALSFFLTGRHSVLLYTERAHHFRRHQISGVRRVVFYGLPDNPAFYAEIAGGYLARSQRSQRLGPGQGSVRAVFSRYDAFRLERIVGSQRIGQMLREQSDTFVFEEERAF
ncbi:nucleolus protein required for cell [Grosmannia clavigera kw1407]|uniref:U3 small nucleolar RNA-associated protein 25 n=1 Tax=Grosmannia clavigera (strain kw1407 / UAMH 11150) TaxID=655863 RepID=F0XSL6_GROCL|nr:nucleolus protein required for cell [Grosmannia clavigera kw1407]EFW99207.1 nucleolus protein required for cell [Grosmannia clavigera kw1407]